jgi:hypothetical protein
MLGETSEDNEHERGRLRTWKSLVAAVFATSASRATCKRLPCFAAAAKAPQAPLTCIHERVPARREARPGIEVRGDRASW